MVSHSQADSHGGVIRSTSVIALGTLSSRFLGFIRDVILAQLLGTAARADAFFVAFRIPNLFRDILGEGAANAAIVPVLSEYAAQKEKEELWNFISVVFILALMLLSAITLLGIILARVAVPLIAPGFIADAEKLQMTIALTRIMFPYLVFIGLTAYSAGVLFTFRSFTVPAFSPCLLNIAVIASALISAKTMKEPVFGLAIGVLVGGAAQLLAQIRPMLKQGIKFIRPRTLSHPGARKIGRLLLPRLVGTGVYQLNVFVDTLCASWAVVVGTGGVAALYYANRIIQFPMGIFGVALASALLPTMSQFAAQGRTGEFKKTLVFSLKNIVLLMLPISAFLVFLSGPVIRVLFQRGAFDAYSTAITSQALLFAALGLVSFAGTRIMVTAFYSLQDTVTPVRIAAVCLAINIIFNLILMFPLKVAGIALASSISGTVNFLSLFYFMNKRLGGIRTELVLFFFKVLAASVLMAAAMMALWGGLAAAPELIRLGLAVVAGFIIFTAACLLLKISEVKDILQRVLLTIAPLKQRLTR